MFLVVKGTLQPFHLIDVVCGSEESPTKLKSFVIFWLKNCEKNFKDVDVGCHAGPKVNVYE